MFFNDKFGENAQKAFFNDTLFLRNDRNSKYKKSQKKQHFQLRQYQKLGICVLMLFKWRRIIRFIVGMSVADYSSVRKHMRMEIYSFVSNQ